MAAHACGTGKHAGSRPLRTLLPVSGGRQVTALRLLLADGRAVECSASQWPELFAAARCGLGCLGVITAVTLQLEPAFRLRESWQTLPLDRVLDDLPAFRHSCEHFKFLWYPHTNDAIAISLNRTTDVRAPPTRPRGGRSVLTGLPPLPFLSAHAQPIEAPATTWLQDRVVNHVALESLLYLASFRPSLVPAINRLYYQLQWGARKGTRVGNSVEVFNFDCLFKQHVSEWAIPR